ncbi:CsbD family protein [Arenibaculum sp.]|uniref:CsbD family protein n=1 Tax=Arenibaculum sp. TaxID=2865862 RepID=UPI002E165BCC|nr:CsbD family protein [Arenibaculum sp.]
MNRDERQGRMKETQGHVEKAAGEALGDDELKRQGHSHEAEGKVDKAAGKVKQGIDKAKDAFKK